MEGSLRVDGGRITEIGADVRPAPSDEVVDATGCYVLPGGVDPHCHVMADVAAAAAGAVQGGTTTLLSFTSPEPGEAPVAAIERARVLVAEAHPVVDVGLHAACYEPDSLSPEDVEAVAAAGGDAIKCFLAYPELGIMATGGGLFRAMSYAARAGLPVQVHCEDGELIEAMVEEASAAGRRHTRTFAEVRPAAAEELAVERVIAFATITGARCYLPHLSTRGALESVRRARLAGGTCEVTAEVCLHHVLLDDRAYGDERAEELLVAPPLRDRAEVEAVAAALADGSVDTVGSDHSQVRTPVDARIARSPYSTYGIAGAGARLPLLLAWGLGHGVAMDRLSHLLSAGPAGSFGYRNKGRLALGMDGDVVVWDPGGEWTVAADSFPDGTGTAPYAGRRVTGRVRSVCLRGRMVVREGELVSTVGAGRIIEPAARR